MIDWHLPFAWWWMLAPLVAWRVLVRLRRLVARQRYSRRVQYLRAAGLGILVIVVAVIAYSAHAAFIALACGLMAGAILGGIGVRLTTFDPCEEGIFFQPNRFLGSALAIVLLGRIAWRLFTGTDDPGESLSVAGFVRNVSTMLLFGLFSAHFIVYALGVIYWTRRDRLRPGRPQVEKPGAE
ncbi:MAG: putative rane protein [Variovorax sp.]|nr:putative rane protein [Variovorax sp.]